MFIKEAPAQGIPPQAFMRASEDIARAGATLPAGSETVKKTTIIRSEPVDDDRLFAPSFAGRAQ